MTTAQKKKLHERLKLLSKQIEKVWPRDFNYPAYRSYYKSAYLDRWNRRVKSDAERKEVRRKLKQYGGQKSNG